MNSLNIMNNIDEQLSAEIESFYKHFEDNLRNYKRPINYVERYLKVVNGSNKRSRVSWNNEGLTSAKTYE